MSIDGISKTLQPGELLKLSPGESVCIEPYIYHSFWRQDEASGKILIGEVSKVNDDKNDNGNNNDSNCNTFFFLRLYSKNATKQMNKKANTQPRISPKGRGDL